MKIRRVFTMLYKYLGIEIKGFNKENIVKKKNKTVSSGPPLCPLHSNQCNALLMSSTLNQFVKNPRKAYKSKTLSHAKAQYT